MRNLEGLTGPVFTCLNVAPVYVDNLSQRRVEKGKTLVVIQGEIHHVEKHTILICNLPATGAVADMQDIFEADTLHN